jgi:magnesium transporter
MPFLSELVNRPVTDIDGTRVGIMQDLIARIWPEFPHPVVEALVIRRRESSLIVPLSAVAALVPQAIALKFGFEHIQPYTPTEEDIFLARDVLDKQIIDKEGARVVRVNDLELVRVNGTTMASNVDVGGMGILRRIGMADAAQTVLGGLRLPEPRNSISWDNIELLRHDQSMRLRVPVEEIAGLHPADVAEILSDLNRLESTEFLRAMDVPHMADALEEVEPDFQASLVRNLPDEVVADVLEEMEPDEAADLLAELPQDRSTDLLALMEKDDADGVRRLLTYPEDSAGGIMTTEYAAVRPDMTVAQATQYLRETADEAETIFYVYVTDDLARLVGVFSLSKLIFADRDRPIADLMSTRVISVELMDNQEDVAQIISKYDLLAVPVVDDKGSLQGIVTADDALDKIIPTAWKKRLPRFYR